MEFLTAVALMSSTLTILLGLFGIESWRREHQGKRQAELAEEALTAFYEVFDVVRGVRSPLSYSSETEEIIKQENEGEDEFQARRSASIVFIRFNKHKELFSKIQAMRYRFRAMFGDAAIKPFEDLRVVTNEIQLAARMLTHYWIARNWRLEEQQEEAIKQRARFEKIFWEYSEDDEINLKINKVKDDIEKICREIIDAKGSLFGIINWKIWGKKK